MIDAERMEAAMLAANPILKTRREYIVSRGEEQHGSWFDMETRTMEDIARVRVRRVVAALNGVDIEQVVAGDIVSLPAVMDRTFVSRLQSALLNGEVCAAIEKVVGAEACSALLGEVAAL